MLALVHAKCKGLNARKFPAGYGSIPLLEVLDWLKYFPFESPNPPILIVCWEKEKKAGRRETGVAAYAS
jgi:hypothetical protein